MKRGKYITALILFAAATVLLALFNLDGFPQALPNTYKLVVSNPAKVDYIGLDQIARQHNLLFCGITQQNTGLQKRTVTFYTGAASRLPCGRSIWGWSRALSRMCWETNAPLPEIPWRR